MPEQDIQHLFYQIAQLSGRISDLERRIQQLEDRLSQLEQLERQHGGQWGSIVDRLTIIETQLNTMFSLLRYGLPIAIAVLGLIISVLSYLLEKALT